MAFLQGVKGVLPCEHRPRPGSLGFIAQAEEQAGPPAGCPWGEVASGLPTRSPPLSESQHPWGLGPRWTVSVLGPTAQCLRARSGLRRSSGSPDRRASCFCFCFQPPRHSTFRPGPLPPPPSRPGPTAPAEPPRSCRLVPHLLPFAPWPRPPEGALPRARLCSVRLPLFSAGPGARSAGAFSPQPRTMPAAGLGGGLLALRSGRLLWSPGATRPLLPAPVKGERVSPAPRPQDW